MFRKQNRRNKFGAKKTMCRGILFASMLEAAVYEILKVKESKGEISDVKVQQKVYLLRDPDIKSIPDFSFIRNGNLCYAEAKGKETDGWKIKKKLWIHFVPYILEIWKGTHQKPKLIEVVIPNKYQNVK